MSKEYQKRIVGLQKALHIAKNALQRIAYNSAGAHGVASTAISEIEQVEMKYADMALIDSAKARAHNARKTASAIRALGKETGQ